MNSQDLYQRVESAIQESGCPTTESGRVSLVKVIDRVYPIIADYVKEKKVVFGIEFQSLAKMFAYSYAENVILNILKQYTLERGSEYGVHVTTLGEGLERNFGKFNKTSVLQNRTGKRYSKFEFKGGPKYNRRSILFYSSEAELDDYLRRSATRETMTEYRGRMRRKRIAVINCNFER